MASDENTTTPPPPPTTTMLMYLYRCKTLWGLGQVSDARYLQYDERSGEDVVAAAKRDAHAVTGATACDVTLLQRFLVSVQPIETFAPTRAAFFPAALPPSGVLGPAGPPSNGACRMAS